MKSETRLLQERIELLAALKTLVNDIDMIRVTGEKVSTIASAREIARAAIIKAEGKDQAMPYDLTENYRLMWELNHRSIGHDKAWELINSVLSLHGIASLKEVPNSKVGRVIHEINTLWEQERNRQVPKEKP